MVRRPILSVRMPAKYWITAIRSVAEPRNRPVSMNEIPYVIMKIRGTKIKVEPLPNALINLVAPKIHTPRSR